MDKTFFVIHQEMSPLRKSQLPTAASSWCQTRRLNGLRLTIDTVAINKPT